jgi:hypothetical protein
MRNKKLGTQIFMDAIKRGEFDCNELQDGFQFTQMANVLTTWILLDNQAMVHVFSNLVLLTNIHMGDGHMQIY